MSPTSCTELSTELVDSSWPAAHASLARTAAAAAERALSSSASVGAADDGTTGAVAVTGEVALAAEVTAAVVEVQGSPVGRAEAEEAAGEDAAGRRLTAPGEANWDSATWRRAASALVAEGDGMDGDRGGDETIITNGQTEHITREQRKTAWWRTYEQP